MLFEVELKEDFVLKPKAVKGDKVLIVYSAEQLQHYPQAVLMTKNSVQAYVDAKAITKPVQVRLVANEPQTEEVEPDEGVTLPEGFTTEQSGNWFALFKDGEPFNDESGKQLKVQGEKGLEEFVANYQAG